MIRRRVGRAGRFGRLVEPLGIAALRLGDGQTTLRGALPQRRRQLIPRLFEAYAVLDTQRSRHFPSILGSQISTRLSTMSDSSSASEIPISASSGCDQTTLSRPKNHPSSPHAMETWPSDPTSEIRVRIVTSATVGLSTGFLRPKRQIWTRPKAQRTVAVVLLLLLLPLQWRWWTVSVSCQRKCFRITFRPVCSKRTGPCMCVYVRVCFLFSSWKWSRAGRPNARVPLESLANG